MLKTLVSWSSGKDSAWMLYRLQHDDGVRVAGLFTTVNQVHQRIAMHAVPSWLLRVQAETIGLPLVVLPIPDPCTNEQYDHVMTEFLTQARISGAEAVAFGDICLEDVRRYRESRMQTVKITPIFPLWGMPTEKLAHEIIDHGFRMIVTCVDPRVMPPELAGREYDRTFLQELPPDVDPCGENGEFYTFVYAGPVFTTPLTVKAGVIVERNGFIFADVEEQNTADMAGGAPT